MEIALVFGGVVVSFLVEILKRKFGTSTIGTMGIVVGLSIVGGVGYSLIQHFGWLNAAIQILAVCGAFYAFIIKNVNDGQ